MKVESEIKKWGNSLALRISGAMAELPGFKEGSKVSIEITDHGLFIEPKKKLNHRIKLPYSENQLLKNITAKKAHADELATLSGSELID